MTKKIKVLLLSVVICFLIFLYVLLSLNNSTVKITPFAQETSDNSAENKNDPSIATGIPSKEKFAKGRYIMKLTSESSTDILRLMPDTDRILEISSESTNSDMPSSINPLIQKLSESGVTKLERLPFSIKGNSYLTFKVDENQSKTFSLDSIANIQGVEYVEPDALLYPAVISDPYYLDRNPLVEERQLSIADGGWNPLFDYQYGLKNIRFDENTLDVYFGGDFIKNAQSTVVAVIDTGIDNTHKEFEGHLLDGRIWYNKGEMGVDNRGGDKKKNQIDDDGNGYIDDWWGWNAVDLIPFDIEVSPDNNPFDKSREDETSEPYGGGHGTHVAGIIASSINGYGLVGVNPKAKIMPLRVCSAGKKTIFGLASICLTSNVVEMIMYAVKNGAQVINISLGTGVDPETLRDAVEFANENNVLVVAAAGNEYGEFILYPARYEGVLAVSAVGPDDGYEEFSSRGDRIHVSAPGGDILSVRSSNSDPYCLNEYLRAPVGEGCQIGVTTSTHIKGKNKDFMTASGTSMAAPHVAGLASLVLAKNPDLTVDEVANIIANGADDLGIPGFDKYYGFGRINIQNTLLKMDTSEVSRARPQLSWDITAKLVCPNGKDPWLPLPQGTFLKVTIDSEKLGDYYREVVEQTNYIFRTGEQKLPTIIAQKNVNHISTLIFGTRRWPMLVQEPLPHKGIIDFSHKSLEQWGYPWTDDANLWDRYTSAGWANVDLPTGSYTITFNPLPDSGFCSDQNWQLETAIVCQNGTKPEKRDSQIIYTDVEGVKNTNFAWKFGENDSEQQKKLIISASPGHKYVYVGMRDSSGNMFPLSGTPQERQIYYNNNFENSRPLAYWQASSLFNYSRQIMMQFTAPDSWCDGSNATPTGLNPTIHPDDIAGQLPQQNELMTLQNTKELSSDNNAETETNNSNFNTDLNNDGVTNSTDIFIVIDNYTSAGFNENQSREQKIEGDVNSDKVVDALDLSAVISGYAVE